MTGSIGMEAAQPGHGIARHGGNVVPLPLPAGVDGQRVVDWALATVAEAEQRLARLQERVTYLEGLSVTDELTGLLNRRGFTAELERALAAARRGSPGGVLMLCDLDGFKLVNDRYGHLVGNEALQFFGQLVAGKIRRNDVFARLSGDEFAGILSGASLANARRKAQSLAQLLAATPLRSGRHRIVLGASFGLAAFDGREDADELMHRADLAMYAEKRCERPVQTA